MHKGTCCPPLLQRKCRKYNISLADRPDQITACSCFNLPDDLETKPRWLCCLMSTFGFPFPFLVKKDKISNHEDQLELLYS